MKQFVTYLYAVCLLTGSCLFTACAVKGASDIPGYSGTQRLVIKGQVMNEDSQALPGMRVDIDGVGDETETNAISYNYAITDNAGRYIICRYLGREIPQEMTVIVSDPQHVYREQRQTITTESYNRINNSVIEITADFILIKNP